MSSTRNKTTQAVETLTAAQESVRRVTELIRNVLLKFPENTLPKPLKPFTWHPRLSFYLSTGKEGTTVHLVHAHGGGPISTFPASLLGAQESVITRWARTQYWSHIQFAKQQNREAAQFEMDRAQLDMEQAKQRLDRAAEKLEAACAPTKKQRREVQMRTPSE